MTVPQEHQSITIEFGLIYNGETGHGTNKLTKHSHSNESRNRAIIVMPTATLHSHRNARNLTQSQHSCCSSARLIIWTLVGFAILYANKMSSIVNFIPQTVRSRPRIGGDYTSIHGIHDLQSSQIRPTCFSGVMDCPCSDPLVAQDGGSLLWTETHSLNQQLALAARDVDVVFLGDSITERWRETEYGKPSPSALGSATVFDSLFSKENGGKYAGLALGISGDTTPMLLWRLQNGELPANLNPSVFWVLVGTNNIGRSWCSAEMVVVGVIRIVEEILRQKHTAMVVINGLLPFTFNRNGYVAKGGSVKPSVWSDVQTINAELQIYATYRDGVSYFDTDVFFKDPRANADQLQIDKELMTDYLHPSPAGYRLWGEEIVEALDALLIGEEEVDDVL